MGQNIILSTSYMTDEEHKAGKVHIITQEATNLFSELFFAQFVESEKLLSKNNVLDEATRSQLDPDDDLSVRYHHSHGPEHNFQVFR